MNKLTINDLPVANELDKRQMAGLLGGMGRTPQQILAWEVTGKPAPGKAWSWGTTTNCMCRRSERPRARRWIRSHRTLPAVVRFSSSSISLP